MNLVMKKSIIGASTFSLGILLAWTLATQLTPVDSNEVQVTRDKININMCQTQRDLLDIEILKEKTSQNGEEDQFTFYAKLINPKIDPSEFLYRWAVKAPETSKVSQEEQDTYRLVLKPDVWGTYHVFLTIGDKYDNCKHSIYVFQYPDFQEQTDSNALHVLQASLSTKLSQMIQSLQR